MDTDIYRKNYDKFVGALKKAYRYKHKNNLLAINKEYRDYLSSDDKQKLTELINKRPLRIEFSESTTVKEYLLGVKDIRTDLWKNSTQIINIYEKNSKNIKEQYLGGKNSVKSKIFSQELKEYSDKSLNEFNAWKSLWSSQLTKSDEFKKQLRHGEFSIYKIVKNDPNDL